MLDVGTKTSSIIAKMKTSNLSVVILLLTLINFCLGARDVLVVSGQQEHDDSETLVEVYDFLSRTWRLIQPQSEVNKRKDAKEQPKPGAARLVNQNAVMELSLTGSSGPASKLASLPAEVEGAASFYYGDTLCLAGGYDTASKTLRKDVLCWNPLSSNPASKWIALPKMAQGRFRAAAVVLDGKLYVSGGYNPTNHEFLDSVEVFDDVSQRWYEVARLLNGGRAGHRLEAVGGKLYAIGGWRRHKFLAEVEQYDSIMDKWNLVAPLSEPLAFFGSVVRNGHIYVVGGQSGFRASDEQSNLRMYSPTKNAWATIEPPMNFLKGKVTAVLAKDNS